MLKEMLGWRGAGSVGMAGVSKKGANRCPSQPSLATNRVLGTKPEDHHRRPKKFLHHGRDRDREAEVMREEEFILESPAVLVSKSA